jgi:aspartate aminotransferase-like enzyme
LCKIAHDNNCITIVDAVTSLGGCELQVDEWEIDAIYSGTQKCLSAMPGISPVSFNERALTKVKNRKTPVTSWFLDLNLVMGYCFKVCSTLSKETAVPQSSSTTTATPPKRVMFSCIRIPNTPLIQTTTLSGAIPPLRVFADTRSSRHTQMGVCFPCL